MKVTSTLAVSVTELCFLGHCSAKSIGYGVKLLQKHGELCRRLIIVITIKA